MTIRATVVGVPQNITAKTVLPIDRSSPSSVSISRTASATITKYQVLVESTDLYVAPADITVTQDNFLGIAQSNALTGFSLDVRLFGEMYDPTWTWSVGSVYCGPGAMLTQDNSSGGLRRVAHAVSAHTIIVDIRDSIDSSSRVLNGMGAPSDAIGSVGDLYLDSSNGDLYGPKTSTWGPAIPLKGPPGETGEQGLPGLSVENFIYYPPTTTNVWTVAHGLGHYPNVVVEDSTGSQVWPDVRYLDINTVEISFAYPTGGRAILT